MKFFYAADKNARNIYADYLLDNDKSIKSIAVRKKIYIIITKNSFGYYYINGNIYNIDYNGSGNGWGVGFGDGYWVLGGGNGEGAGIGGGHISSVLPNENNEILLCG